MTRFWKRGAAAVGALVVAGGLAATAPAAGAATTAKPENGTTPVVSTMSAKAKAAYSCPNHRVCIYQYKGFKGKKSVIRKSHRKLGWWNNKISSVINRTRYPICVYNSSGYRGRFPGHPHTQYYLGAKKKGSYGSGGNLSKVINNRISSYRFAPKKNVRRC